MVVSKIIKVSISTTIEMMMSKFTKRKATVTDGKMYFLSDWTMACSLSDTPALKDLPKVAVDLKSQLEGFNTSCLRDVDTNEKIILPSAEGTILKNFTAFRNPFYLLCLIYKCYQM